MKTENINIFENIFCLQHLTKINTFEINSNFLSGNCLSFLLKIDLKSLFKLSQSAACHYQLNN